MSLPADPKRLTVINRVFAVLKAIREGDSYFHAAASVEKRYTHFKEVTKGPAYSVHLDSGGKFTAGSNGWWSLEFFINVKGVIVNETDPTSMICRAIRDVRYALDQDMASSTAGSFGALCDGLFFDEEADSDNGYLSLEGKGQFEQRIRIVISGTIGTL